MDAIVENFPAFVGGFLMTVRLLVISGLGALVIGTLVAAMRISPIPALRGFVTTYTEIVRNTPLTLVLFFCAFVLPSLGLRLDFVAFALIGLTVYTSPFVAEALRSGINGVPVGQAEAARALGLRFGQTVGLVVLPQAIRMVIPPLINVLIALTKNTSVAAGFSVLELVAVSRQVIQFNGNATIPILIAVAVFYLLITIPLGLIAGRLERRVVMGR
ncbi:glutamate transport system permease protein [Microbacteriaceae bacterium SG_E_30_P1]|uniref:Glutamate transport system permease protein n=1 Tax=Antiquaquibacter oligotrophicus TaxID=2880260 RepID=A0ABT6KL28_9MICO|nr:amino acid ABC transporter permease [Antiquaquibacter oligotrophicus]MDH6180712.1 glutamate transport system permease protein [Antiquaquibacter oligotrophicus]UDF13562.1 amino acid ABC transporter permease [Antiquaquibacter oligotrophicus]